MSSDRLLQQRATARANLDKRSQRVLALDALRAAVRALEQATALPDPPADIVADDLARAALTCVERGAWWLEFERDAEERAAHATGNTVTINVDGRAFAAPTAIPGRRDA